MKEVLISSAVLISALTALRFLFRNRISRRLQYALWGLVLLRLVLPVSLPEARFSVMTGAERLAGQMETVRPDPSVSPVTPVSPVFDPTASHESTSTDTFSMITSHPGSTSPHASASPGDSVLGLWTENPLLPFIWLAGMGLTLGCFLLSNLRFALRLRRGRIAFNAPGCPLPVYVSEAAVSPCLFGLFRPTVYLTPKAALEPEEQLRHVLTHELCHYRHGDHVWSTLRCLVVSFYWFDPFVWLAAALSRVDGELACDEAAIRTLGEEQRLSYGKTLVDMIAVRNVPSGLFCTATTMISDKKSLKKRLEHIVQRQKPFVWAVALTLLAAAALAGCTFTAAKRTPEPSDAPESYIEYAEIPDAELEAVDSQYDLFRFHHNVENSPKLTVWAERWENGNVTDWGRLADFNLSDGPEDLDIGFYELMEEDADFRDLDFLVSRQGETLHSSIYIPAGGEFRGRVTTWLGSGNVNRHDVTAKEPIILLGIAWHNADNGSISSYDCEYLMENPDALKKYELIVLIKCAFAGEDGQNAPLPVISAPDDTSDVQASYEVTLITDSEYPVTGFDPSLPGDVIFNGLIKSAAWPTDSYSAGFWQHPYTFHIRQTLTSEDGSESHDYQAYRLDDGTAILSMGGMYTTLDEALMVQLETAAGVEPGQIYNLEAAITKAILEHVNGPGEFQTEVHATLDFLPEDHEDGSQVTAYVIALGLSFDSDGKTLSETGGSFMPVAITFDKNQNGAYTLSEYWTPEDGAYYAPSIREKFPAGIAETAITDSQEYAMTFYQVCYGHAISRFGLDLTEEIAERVDILCNTPDWETPSPYVEPGYLDFRQLLYYQGQTLRYVFSEFLKGGQTGERGRVLYRLMEELLHIEDPPAGDGQTSFDQWKDTVLQLYHENGYLHTLRRVPEAQILLDLMGLSEPLISDAPAPD